MLSRLRGKKKADVKKDETPKVDAKNDASPKVDAKKDASPKRPNDDASDLANPNSAAVKKDESATAGVKKDALPRSDAKKDASPKRNNDESNDAPKLNSAVTTKTIDPPASPRPNAGAKKRAQPPTANADKKTIIPPEGTYSQLKPLDSPKPKGGTNKTSPNNGEFAALSAAAEAVGRESFLDLNKFHYGQRVRIIEKQNVHKGKQGTIVEYDLLEDRWRILMDDGSGKMVPARNIEPSDVSPDSWVRYQVPGNENEWAYYNPVSQATRWDCPPNVDARSVEELLPATARAFIFYIGERWRSLTRAYEEICQVAAELRPYETASLTAGASIDREDFMAACAEMMLVRDGDPEVARRIFEAIDIDGRDHILTITDFHAADRRYRSASHGAMGQVEPPIGLLLFHPELVPPMFKDSNSWKKLSFDQQLMRLVEDEERLMRTRKQEYVNKAPRQWIHSPLR